MIYLPTYTIKQEATHSNTHVLWSQKIRIISPCSTRIYA